MVISWTGFALQLEPVGLFQFQAHGLLFGQVVEHAHRDGYFVAHGERERQIQVDKEILEDAQGSARTAQPAILRRGQGGHPPGGDAVRYRDVQGEGAIRPGHSIRQPQHRLGEVLAQARRLAARCLGGFIRLDGFGCLFFLNSHIYRPCHWRLCRWHGFHLDHGLAHHAILHPRTRCQHVPNSHIG